MSDATLEQRAAEKRAFWIKISVGILIFLSGGSVFVLLSIVPKFEQIFADAFPGRPLPVLTDFLIRERLELVLFVLALPIPALVMFWRRKPYAIFWINLGIVWFFLQFGIIVYALFIPMVGIEVGMSDAPLKPGP
jgi:hypothetical protein